MVTQDRIISLAPHKSDVRDDVEPFALVCNLIIEDEEESFNSL